MALPMDEIQLALNQMRDRGAVLSLFEELAQSHKDMAQSMADLLSLFEERQRKEAEEDAAEAAAEAARVAQEETRAKAQDARWAELIAAVKSIVLQSPAINVQPAPVQMADKGPLKIVFDRSNSTDKIIGARLIKDSAADAA